MTLCRDWLATLWAASYKGFPFYVERDDESGGRRIVVHEFPKRDDPFLEDLGEAPRNFEATAYVASGTADAEATAFLAVLASQGAGLLVLPTHGPRLVRCLSFSRERSKDRHGYIGLRLRFCREGASSALPSVGSLANAVSTAADALASVAGGAFQALASAIGAADFVVSAATGAIASAAGALDLIRAGGQLASEPNAAAYAAASSLADTPGDLVDRSTGVSDKVATLVFDLARDIGGAMDAGRAASAFADLVAEWPPVIPGPGTASELAAAANAGEVARVVRLAGLAAYAEALVRIEFPSRSEGVTARGAFVERIDAELEETTGAALAPVYVALQQLRNQTVDYLSSVVADLAPVISVEVPLSMPSLFVAWRLYQDPARARELVDRNKVPHPSFMPNRFEALSR